MPSCVECFVLLHSPIIIDMKELEAINIKVQKNVTDDEMDNDIYTQEMSDFFSTAAIVTGCILKMEDNSFSWMYEIELNKQHNFFCYLMNFLLDCSVEDEKDEICMFDFTNGHLQDKISSDIKWTTFKQTRANAELVSLAMALNGDKQILIVGTENSKKIEVTYTTIEDTLTMHYPIEERNLKQLGNDDTSRRSRPMYKKAIKIRKDVFLNGNIVTVKQNIFFFDADDYQEVIASTAKNVSLNVSAILELAHKRIGDVPYSLEAALLSSAHIRFPTGVDGYACAYQIFFECCEQNICNNETAPFTMDNAMMGCQMQYFVINLCYTWKGKDRTVSF
jgi:hypothetical protein